MLLKCSLLEAASLEFLEMTNVPEPLTYVEACSSDGYVAFVARSSSEVCAYLTVLTNLAVVHRVHSNARNVCLNDTALTFFNQEDIVYNEDAP